MAYGAKTYTLREESTESGKRYFISFKDGQGEHHEIEVSEKLFLEFRQMEGAGTACQRSDTRRPFSDCKFYAGQRGMDWHSHRVIGRSGGNRNSGKCLDKVDERVPP